MALRRLVRQLAVPLTSSEIARVELGRVGRVAGAKASAVRAVLDGLNLVSVTPAVVEAAEQLASASLRTLDAIHLASALEIGADTMFVYDRRLAQAAREAGIAVLAPGA